ncbi:uncharacterized protein LOC122528841 [Frieseomelitta varia]|uniref:uncharacterized protein LOC122528841 n=1 Tax=Frieseomelitta varia TaxID=561572 RepID=UPI001CB68647|nr:uncharacterized protein LOC122528841 [Frieseomelitta varia]
MSDSKAHRIFGFKPSSKFSVETLDLSSISSRSAALSRVLICTRVVCCPSRTQRWMFHPSAAPEQQGCRAPVTTVLVKTLLYTYIRRGDIVLRTIYTYNVRAYDLTHHLFFIFNITS